MWIDLGEYVYYTTPPLNHLRAIIWVLWFSELSHPDTEEEEEEGEIVDANEPQAQRDVGVEGADELSSDSDHFYELPSPIQSSPAGMFLIKFSLQCSF